MALNGNGREFLRMNMHAREFCGATRNLAAHPYRGLARSLFAALLLCLQAGTSLAGPAPQAEWQLVSQQEILEAMRLPVGYDPTATTNAARFQADVLLHLARQAKARDPRGQPLLLRRSDWFQAFLTRTGRTVENAPTYALLSYQHAQDIVVEYRTDRVIRRVEEGATPELALNVMLWWEPTSDAPDRYSYLDSLSTPTLSVTNKSVITYRLLDMGDMVVYDQIEGLAGRPTSGALGLLFRIMGEGSVVWSRTAIAPDGVQVTRARVKIRVHRCDQHGDRVPRRTHREGCAR